MKYISRMKRTSHGLISKLKSQVMKGIFLFFLEKRRSEAIKRSNRGKKKTLGRAFKEMRRTCSYLIAVADSRWLYKWPTASLDMIVYTYRCVFLCFVWCPAFFHCTQERLNKGTRHTRAHTHTHALFKRSGNTQAKIYKATENTQSVNTAE